MNEDEVKELSDHIINLLDMMQKDINNMAVSLTQISLNLDDLIETIEEDFSD